MRNAGVLASATMKIVTVGDGRPVALRAARVSETLELGAEPLGNSVGIASSLIKKPTLRVTKWLGDIPGEAGRVSWRLASPPTIQGPDAAVESRWQFS